MPVTRLIADALGVVTICLVCLLVLLGLLCIAYSIYFRYRIRRQGYTQLGYFNRPWIIRITFIFFSSWWAFGEIFRLNFLRREGKILNAFKPKWQETVCKGYIISNLGFAEPCLVLTIVFLLRASLQGRDIGALSPKWNGKISGRVILCCLPVLVLQIMVVLAGLKFNNRDNESWKLPSYFTSTTSLPVTDDHDDTTLCTYPLPSVIPLGMYATLLTAYLLWLGRQMVSSVINKGLRRRVLYLIFSVSSLFTLRVILLGLSVLSKPEHFSFEALGFSAFFVLLVCTGMGICMLVYLPVADTFALRGSQDLETGSGRPVHDHHDAISLVANQSQMEASSTTSLGRNSDASTKRGSIYFRTMLKDDTFTEVFEELGLFSHGTHRATASSLSDSPPLLGHSMFPLSTEMYESPKREGRAVVKSVLW